MSNTVVVIHQMGMLFFGNIFFFMCIVVIVGNKCLFSGGGGIGLMIYSKSRYIGLEKLWNYSGKAKSVMKFLQKSLMNHLLLIVQGVLAIRGFVFRGFAIRGFLKPWKYPQFAKNPTLLEMKLLKNGYFRYTHYVL